jgi:serine/threonine protein kinase
MAESVSQFEIVGEIGKGSFGTVYRGWHNKLAEYVAVKVEKNSNFQLKNEYRILSHLKGKEGFPNVHWFGKIDDSYVMVMELLGPSLEVMRRSSKNYSMHSACIVGIQVLDRLETLHTARLIHRDLKPENTLYGLGNKKEELYLIDYGLSKPFKNKNGVHIEQKEGKKLTGTARYASISTHLGLEQSRRDDLEIMFYMLIYIHFGSLPW